MRPEEWRLRRCFAAWAVGDIVVGDIVVGDIVVGALPVVGSSSLGWAACLVVRRRTAAVARRCTEEKPF
jgi:hypothetical protein